MQVLVLGGLLRQMVGYAAGQQHSGIQGPPQQAWRSDIGRPLDGFAAQVEIGNESQPERGGFYQTEPDGSPPYDAAMAKGVSRQVGDVEDRVQLHRVPRAGAV